MLHLDDTPHGGKVVPPSGINGCITQHLLDLGPVSCPDRFEMRDRLAASHNREMRPLMLDRIKQIREVAGRFCGAHF